MANKNNIQHKTRFVPLMTVLATAVSCHVHTPDEGPYRAVQVVERNILDTLLSDHDRLEEHDGQCLIKVMQPQGMGGLDTAMDALEVTDPLIIAAKYPLVSSVYNYFTPLMYAVSMQSMPAVQRMLAAYDDLDKDQKLSNVQYAIPSDIQNSRPPNAGHTALLLAIIAQDVALARVLVENGAPVNMHFSQAVGELGGSTPVHVGVATKNSTLLETVIVSAWQRVNLEIQDAKNESTPLDLALSRNYMDVAKCLLKYGANPNSIDYISGWRPLSRAVLKKDPGMLELLLSYGANPYLADADAMETTSLYKALVQRCTARLDLVRLFFDYVIDVCATDAHGTEIKPDINFQFKDGMTSLHVAVLQGDIKLVRLILDLGSDVDPTDASGNTPLQLAITTHNRPVVELLLSYGADINTLLCDAITERQNLALIKEILSYPEVNVNRPMYDNGCTALHLAVIQGFDLTGREEVYDNLLSILRCLLSCRRTNVNAENKNGNTALHFTIMLDRRAMTEAMLEHHLVKLNIRNHQGEAPLHRALRKAIECKDKANKDKALQCLSLLLKQPRIDVNLKNGHGYTPLHLATAANRPDLLQLLSAHPEADFNAKDSSGNTPLHTAVGMHSLSLVQKCLSDSKTNVNVQNNLGNTPLHLVAPCNIPSIASALMRRSDIQPNIQNWDGDAPIHAVMYCNALKILPILLSDERVNPNTRDMEGYTPLHIAILHGRKQDAAEMLLQAPRLDLSISNEDGDTPLDLAKEYGTEEPLLSMLLERMAIKTLSEMSRQ